MTLEDFNRLEFADSTALLLDCCHCQSWAERVAERAPFEDLASLMTAADEIWLEATEAEILEAFSGHPQIGDVDALRSKYAETANAEQGQVFGATEETLLALKAANDAYLAKNNFIFIVCASGKSAEEMLALVQARLNNSRDQELVNGAREQGAITELRLRKTIEE